MMPDQWKDHQQMQGILSRSRWAQPMVADEVQKGLHPQHNATERRHEGEPGGHRQRSGRYIGYHISVEGNVMACWAHEVEM